MSIFLTALLPFPSPHSTLLLWHFQDQGTQLKLVGIAHKQVQPRWKELGKLRRSRNLRCQDREPPVFFPLPTLGTNCSIPHMVHQFCNMHRTLPCLQDSYDNYAKKAMWAGQTGCGPAQKTGMHQRHQVIWMCSQGQGYHSGHIFSSSEYYPALSPLSRIHIQFAWHPWDIEVWVPLRTVVRFEPTKQWLLGSSHRKCRLHQP